jgi:predicted transcriptional regulator
MLKRRLIPLSVKRAAIALSLILIVIGCFAAQAYQQKIFKYSYSEEPVRRLQVYSGITSLKAITIDEYCMLAFSPSTMAQTPQSSFSNSNCTQIYDFINENPGIQFRGICAGLCLPVGLVQYYVGGLVKAGLVSFIRDGRYKRFFISKRFSKREMAAISLLRHKTAKKIVEVLLCKKQLSHGRLACEVSITSQALTWQMKALRNTEFILHVNEGLKTIYSLDESSAPLLQKYLAIVN